MRILLILALAACPSPTAPTPAPAPPNAYGTVAGTQVVLTSATETTAFIAFGSDSKLLPAAIPACGVSSGLVCQLKVKGSFAIPNEAGLYLNATIAFGSPVGCGSTKAEINVNNPAWFDTMDVSLVDGFSNPIAISYTPTGGSKTVLGPPLGKDGNEKLMGVFPYGCDICTAQQNPPCGIPAGGTGCKAGTQYDPKPPCQFSGGVKGGGKATVEIFLK